MAPALGRVVHIPRQRRQRGKGKADGRSPKSTPALGGNFTKLRRVRTRRRAHPGDEWLHPLSLLEFLDKDFGQRPLLLQRGPLHRLPLSSSTAAELLRSYRMGINAHVVSSRLRSEKTASLSVGAKPLEVLAQGRSIRLDHLERRSSEPPCLKWILKRLKDVTPGLRSPTLSLTWAPPWVSPSFGRAKTPPWTSHRLHLQLFGARQWTLCNDPLGPEVATPNTSAVNGSGSDATPRCQRFRLRRGDLLYVPPGLWHGATAGAALSAHLTLTLQPLTMQELLLAGSPGSLSGLPTGAHGLAQPLPLWRSDPSLRDLCLSLPWRQTWHRDNACKEDHLHLALQRLFLGLGRRSPRRGLGLPVTNSEEPKREFQSEPIESLRPEGREGNRQRRTRELIFMALCWPILIFVVTFLTYLCCPNGKAHSPLQPSANAWKKYQ